MIEATLVVIALLVIPLGYVMAEIIRAELLGRGVLRQEEDDA